MAAKPATILIVDDDKIVIEQLLAHFRRRNFEPIATANPKIIEQTLNAFEVQLILLDLRMERLDGYEVLRRLGLRKEKIPVLIITAYYEDEKEQLEQVGIKHEDVIEKPFRDFTRIEAAINRKLNRVIAPDEVGSDYEDEIYYDNKTRILVVDDEKEITEILAEILIERRYEVVSFHDGKKAIQYIRDNQGGCHIAIVDMAIPGMLGHCLIEEALKIKPALKIIPVSARYAAEMKEKLRSVGFDPDKLVAKPFDLPRLVEQIKVLATEAGTLGASS